MRLMTHFCRARLAERCDANEDSLQVSHASQNRTRTLRCTDSAGSSRLGCLASHLRRLLSRKRRKAVKHKAPIWTAGPRASTRNCHAPTEISEKGLPRLYREREEGERERERDRESERESNARTTRKATNWLLLSAALASPAPLAVTAMPTPCCRPLSHWPFSLDC